MHFQQFLQFSTYFPKRRTSQAPIVHIQVLCFDGYRASRIPRTVSENTG